MAARTAIAVTKFKLQFPGQADPAAVAGDVANGNLVPNNGRTVLKVKNTNGTSTAHTVTFNLPDFRGHDVTPDTESIAAGATKWYGPFPLDTYTASLLVNVDHAELVINAFSF